MTRKDGRDRREYYRQWNAENRDSRREYMRAYYAANRDRIHAQAAVSRLSSEYGLSSERLKEMLAAQQGACYLCGEPLELEGKNKFHIDHDHSCCRGRRSCGTCVRGLSCRNCNVAIGYMGDDPDRMRRVADNLEMANRRLRDPGSARAIDPLDVSEQPGRGVPGRAPSRDRKEPV